MLEFLVTSAVRRRLLELLWRHGVEGTASALAERSKVAFAAAYRELKQMERYGLVRSRLDHAATVYAANAAHPGAEVLRKLVGPNTSADRTDHEDATTRGQLRSLGAPLPDEAVPVDDAAVERALVGAVRLARRDPTVARAVPVAFWKQRARLDQKRLAAAAANVRESHATGFFLALTADLAGEPTLARWATALRDRRVTRDRPFFLLPSSRSADARAAKRTPPLAREWRFVMDLDRDAFADTFEKFTDEEV